MIFKLRNTLSNQATAIPPGVFQVGREDHNYIQLEDSTVSRTHAQLVNGEQGFFVQDLGSANGTFLNGQRVEEPRQVRLGDIITIGSTGFRLEPEVAGEPSKTDSRGLKSVNPNRAIFRKDTEKLPPRRIHFEESGAENPEAAATTSLPAPAVGGPPRNAAPAKPKAVAAAVAAPPAAVEPNRLAKATQPVGAAAPAPASAPALAPEVRYVVALPAALWLALLAGFGIGLLVGALLF